MAWEFKVTNGPEAGKCEAIQDPAQHPCDFFYPSLSLSPLETLFIDPVSFSAHHRMGLRLSLTLLP